MLSRYYYAARKFKIRNIIRITSDCPLIDYETLDSMIKIFFKKKLDMAKATHLVLPAGIPPANIEYIKNHELDCKDVSEADCK